MKSGKVLVSVVMSVYNDEQYLKESLDSIFAQTIQDFELIIVDDCSTDRTVEIIENYHDDRIHYSDSNKPCLTLFDKVVLLENIDEEMKSLTKI